MRYKFLKLQNDAKRGERRAFKQAISQKIEDHPDFFDFIFSVTRQISRPIHHIKGFIKDRVYATSLNY